MLNTKNNPGAFQPQDPITIRKVISNSMAIAKNGQWRFFLNYLLASSVNLLNESLIVHLQKNKFYCPTCETNQNYFIHHSNSFRIAWNSACPNCNSRARHRGLLYLYQDMIPTTNECNVLHFAPEPVLKNIFLNSNGIKYSTTDYLLKDVDFPNEDIQSLSFTTASFDLVLCNHVIEHVPNDMAAFNEISRILKVGGKAVITIPGNWNRRKTILFKDLSNNGHYRDYGMDVVDLLRSIFSKVEVKDLHDYNIIREKSQLAGIPKNELAFICIK